MPISKVILGYIMTALVFFAIDLLWLGLIAKNLYNRQLGHVLAPQVNWTAALIFYFLFIIGILIFAVIPALTRDNFQYALIYGVLFGFFTYATYDLTNLATLKDWPIKIVLIDIVWGMILTGSTASAGFYLFKWLN